MDDLEHYMTACGELKTRVTKVEALCKQLAEACQECNVVLATCVCAAIEKHENFEAIADARNKCVVAFATYEKEKAR